MKPVQTSSGIVLVVDDSDLLVCAGVDVSADQVPDEIDVLSETTFLKRVKVGDTVQTIKIDVTADDIDACLAHFKARRERHPNRDLVIDYEHQTLMGSEAPAAGWIIDLLTIVRDGKKVLRAKVGTWTDRAKEYIKNKEYRYVSPVFSLGATDKETGKKERCMLKNAALTNEPLIDDLAPIVAKHTHTSIVPGKDTTMDELLERLRWFLNLPTTSTGEEILTELNKLVTQVQTAISASAETTAKDILAFLTSAKESIAAKATLFQAIGAKDDATLEEVRALVVVAKGNSEQVGPLTARVKDLEAKELDREFNRIIAKAFSAGRILPTQKADTDWLNAQREFAAKDPVKFEAFWDKQPVIGPVGELPPTGEAVSAKGITDEDRTVASAMGVSEAALKKHNS